MRLDQWLWAIRVYKSRSLAVAAIRSGHARVNEVPAKPAHTVRPGDRIAVKTETLLRTFKVLALPDSRVGAPLVRDYTEELTPPEEFARAKEAALLRRQFSPPGAGRPTKRARRSMEAFRKRSDGCDSDGGE
jgi:ribosome-associated heat shock protein Hsp15